MSEVKTHIIGDGEFEGRRRSIAASPGRTSKTLPFILHTELTILHNSQQKELKSANPSKKAEEVLLLIRLAFDRQR